MHIQTMAKVYSYTRFSTPEQAAGDSLRRQTDAAQRWADARGLELDQRLSLSDLGVSAYRGANTGEDRGLGGFVYACREKLIEPGSYFLVESLDRISRMPPIQARRIFEDIVLCGVTVVTLGDGQEYTIERLTNDPIALILPLLVSWRAHEESKTKGRRVAEAWSEKRRKVRAGEATKLTERAPAWLRWVDDKWTEDKGRADIVRRVYAMTLAGDGEHKIAACFNGESVPVLGRGAMWHRSSVSKLLRNPAVVGRLVPGYMEFTDGHRRRVTEEPIEGAFPVIVALDDWAAVRAIKDGSSSRPRGRHATAPLRSIFAGLARCPDCGAAMTRVMKGNTSKGGRPKLVCTRAKAGKAQHYVSVPQEVVEDMFLRHWAKLMVDAPAGDRAPELDRVVQDLEGAVSSVVESLDNLTILLARSPSATLAAQIRKTEEGLRVYQGELADARDRQSLADAGVIHSRLAQLQDAVEPDEGEPVEPAKVNSALKTLFSGVTIDHHEGVLWFHWRQGGDPCGIRYDWTNWPND